MTFEYIDRNAVFTQKGNYSIDGNFLTTVSLNDSIYYTIGDNMLTQLAKDKKPITGDLATHFILRKKHD